jgi:cytochrome c
MRVPLIIRIGGLVLATTGFYAYVGQMVPQKEVQPPQETVLASDLTTADMANVGRQIMEGKGFCLTCHTIGKTGALRFPDLAGVDVRAKSRVPGLSDVEYFAQSMYEPNAFVVPGFVPGMPTINQPPIGLTDQEILCVIAYLQTLGGTPTVTLQTTHRYHGAAAAPGGLPAPPAGPDAPGRAQPLPRKGVRLRPAIPSPHNQVGAPQARPAGVERGNGAPANDGVGGSGGAKPPGRTR